MSVLVVGSVALDSVETPFGTADRVVGGSANYFAAAASLFGNVNVVGVVGEDYPMEQLSFLEGRGVDFSGVTTAPGESFFWAGRYSYDLNNRDTLETRLGVFAEFDPVIPEAFRDARLVFLGNIDPTLQLRVLDQVEAPGLVACDTMNFWIEGRRHQLLELLGRVDVVLLNDAEARQLSGEHNLLHAARWIQDKGVRYVVIKKGEHGAILYGPDWMFFAPGYPLEEVFDPTGAGDSFAGGFMGSLAGESSLDRSALRRAMIYGSATGSYAVERFSVERFRELTPLEVARRVEEFREMTTFEHELEAF
ncbi:MAG: sugar kinase [Gemmatimonadales bacterium]|jgi:sugar/nucleoside kinase (ribokinase family)|nr:MAG: sugar kinase [Gemmatimonadales bacterium]